MEIVAGLFLNNEDADRALADLNRHRFVDRGDAVSVIDQAKISPEEADAIEGEENPLDQTLIQLGILPDKVHAYTEQVRQGATVIIVRTGEDRVEEASNIMSQANASEVSTRSL